MINIEANTHAPDFTLPDFKGHDRSLSDLTDKRNILLVFNRGFL